MRETQFNVAPVPTLRRCIRFLSRDFYSSSSSSFTLSPLMLPVEPIHLVFDRQKTREKVRGCANARHGERLNKRAEETRGWQGGSSSRVVHLSLISRGMPPSPRLSTKLRDITRVDERGGYGRNARVLAKHDLFYRSLRAASIIPGRSAGSYLPFPVSRTGPDMGVERVSPTGDQQV